MTEVSDFQFIGLSEQAASILMALLEKHVPCGSVILYGSRAKGNFTERSDMDLVVKNAGTTEPHYLSELQEEIDESDFPYLCDIQYLENIGNASLLDHINRVGKVLLQKETT